MAQECEMIFLDIKHARSLNVSKQMLLKNLEEKSISVVILLQKSQFWHAVLIHSCHTSRKRIARCSCLPPVVVVVSITDLHTNNLLCLMNLGQ